MLLIMILDQYSNYYKALEIYTGYFNSLDIMIVFSYPSSIVITRAYCILKPWLPSLCRQFIIFGSGVVYHILLLYLCEFMNIMYWSFQNVFAMALCQYQSNYHVQNVEIWRRNVECADLISV